MVYCAVFGCKNNNKKTKKPREVVWHFFKFPKDARVRKQWIQRCCRQDTFNADTARICSGHFRDDDYPLKYQLPDYSPKQKLLKPGVVPTCNLPTNVDEVSVPVAIAKVTKKRIKKIFSQDHSEKNYVQIPIDNGNDSNEEAMDYEDKCERERQYKRIYLLEAEIRKLKEELTAQQQKLLEHQEEMKKVFSKTQILEAENTNWQSVNWSTEDICSALTLHAAEPRAYNTLLKKNYPLPSFSTLKSWAPKLRIQNNG